MISKSWNDEWLSDGHDKSYILWARILPVQSYNKLKLLKKFFIWFDIGFLVKLSMIPMNLGLKMDQNLDYIHIFVILFMNEI